MSANLDAGPPATEAVLEQTADLLMDLIRSIEPSIETWDNSGRSRVSTVTGIGLVRFQGCMRIGIFRDEAYVGLMFDSDQLPDPANLLMDGVPFLPVTPENVSNPALAQLIRDAFALCRSAKHEQSKGGIRSALGRLFGQG